MAPDSNEMLLAIHEINRVIHRYCRAMDRIDAALGYTVWHAGGIADFSPMFTGLGHDYVDWACDFHRTLAAHSHIVGNVLIETHGDRAASETYVSFSLLAVQDHGHLLTIGRGRYLDRWSRRNSVWAIDNRKYVRDLSVTHEVDAMVGWGSRNQEDLSYALFKELGAV